MTTRLPTNILLNLPAEVNGVYLTGGYNESGSFDSLSLLFDPHTVPGGIPLDVHALISRSDVLTPLVTAAEEVIKQLPSLKANTASNGHLYDLKRAIEALIMAVEATK